MPRVRANGIGIEYADFGDREAGRPLLIVRGLGTQMIQWPAVFIDRLVDAGHRVIAFDNRDVGRSEWFDQTMDDATSSPAYTLDDMADDVAGLMTALGIDSAHVAGISLGGMITAAVAYRHPSRVRSLVPIMASTGNPNLPLPTPAALEALMAPAPMEREAFIAHHVRTSKALASPGYPTPDRERAAMAARVYDRAFHPAGTARQYAAVAAAGDRRPEIARIDAPTLVIHGLDDPLVRVEAGRDLCETIPGAELLEIPGMGHDVPEGLATKLASAIGEHTAKAEARPNR